MDYTKTQQAALDFVNGQVSIETVAAAIREGNANQPREEVWTSVGKTYAEMDARIDADEVANWNENGWDGVVTLYNTGRLSTAQFRGLVDAITAVPEP